jgi:hypothetical protein
MSDDDLWRPKSSADGPADEPDDEPADEPSTPAHPPRDVDMTQPITGGSGPGSSADAPPPPPPSPPGPSYDAPLGPGAVPPPANPYGQSEPGGSGRGQGPFGAQPGPYGEQQPPPNPYGTAPHSYGAQQHPYQPPPNPYPQPQEYGVPQSPYGTAYPPAYAGGGLPDHPSSTTSMVLGIIGLAGILFCGGLTLVLSPFAWGIGAKSVREIDQQPGRYGGRDKAQAGKWMGIIGTVLLVLGVLAIVFLVIVGIAVGSSDSGPVGPNRTFRSG